MTAYLLVDLDIHDAEGFQEYRSKVPEFIAKHGGKYPVAGGEFEVIEGGWQPHRLALFKFPDRQSIRNFFTDPDFAEVAAIRRRSCQTIVVAIDGVD
jgi:uncharacterized protein (DUF1330 family)